MASIEWTHFAHVNLLFTRHFSEKWSIAHRGTQNLSRRDRPSCVLASPYKCAIKEKLIGSCFSTLPHLITFHLSNPVSAAPA